MIKTRVTGVKESIKAIKDNEKKILVAIDKAVHITASVVQQDAITLINTQVRGGKRIYRGKRIGKGDKAKVVRRKSYGDHHVSPEGEAPNTDTGHLVQNINVSHIRGSLAAEVYSNLDYAAHLEFVLNRPWLSTAAEGSDDLLRHNMQEFVNRVKS